MNTDNLPPLEYNGQSIDELIAAERTHRIDSIIVAIDMALGQKWARLGQDALTPEEEVVVVVERFESDVNNGGFSLFFENAPECVGPIAAALRRIGCNQTAEIAEHAIARLNAADTSSEAVSAALMRCSESDRALLDGLSDRLFAATDSIEQGLFRFIKMNRHRFSF